MKKLDPAFEGSTLTRVAFAESALTLYFGSSSVENPYRRYVRRAYRDLSRTIVGLGSLDSNDRDVLRDTAGEVVHSCVMLLSGGSIESTAEAFDAWHQTTCRDLGRVYEAQGIAFTIGQAQKWVNMTLKYVYLSKALGVEGFVGIGAYYRWAHMPIDNIVLRNLAARAPEVPRLPTRWSRHGDYPQYLAVQTAVRQKYGCGLDADFVLWSPVPEREQWLLDQVARRP